MGMNEECHRFRRIHLEIWSVLARFGFAVTFTEFINGIDALVTKGAQLSDLKAYIATAHEQAEAAENELTQAQEDYAELKRMHSELQKKHGALRVQLAQGEVDVVKVSVLEALADTEGMTVEAIAKHLQMSVGLTRMHLSELYKMEPNMIYQNMWSDGRPSIWKITPTGTRYLFNRGLVK